MKRLKQLQDRKAALVKEGEELLAKASTENRDLSAEEQAAFDKTEADLAAVGKDIEREEKLLSWQADLAKPVQTGVSDLGDSAEPKKIRIEGVYTKPKNFKSAEDAYLCGRYLRAGLTRNPDDIKWCQEHGVQLLAASGAHTSSNNASSGVFVPEPMLNTIIELRERYGKLRQNAMVVPMTSETLSMPRWVSGLTVYYPGENTDITASKTAHNMVSLTARKYAAMAIYPMELMSDAVISFADLFAKEVAEAFAKAEDTNGFLGDGTTTYGGTFGIVTKINDGNHAASIATAATGNTAFSTLDLVDFNKVLATAPQYVKDGGNAKWYISSAGYEDSMARLSYASGGNTKSDLNGGLVKTFLGYPVVEVQVLNSTLTADTSAIKCLFGDLSAGVMLGDRQQVSVAADSSRYFEADQIAMKATQRIDINAHSLGDGSTAGPIIALKTPGA